MSKAAILKVMVIGDNHKLKKSLQDSEQSAGRFGKALGAIGKAAGALAVAGGAAMTALAVAGVKAAADLEQSTGAVDTVFKQHSGQMHQYAKDAATNLGLAQNEYNELATLIGTQLKNGGTALEEMGGKTNELITLGADLASMFGGSTSEAVSALSSALKGERDPIEKYGVSLNQARIEAKAAELGFTKVGGALSAEANQAATLALIMEQTADAHGNFGRETNTFAGQVAILTAQWDNFVAQVGTALLPVLTAAMGFLTSVAMPALQQLGDLVGTHIQNALGAVTPLIENFTAGLSSTSGAGINFNQLFENAKNILANLMPKIEMVMNALSEFGSAVIPVVIDTVSTLLPVLQNLGGNVLGTVLSVMGALIPVLTTIGANLFPALGTVISTLAPVIGNLVSAVGTLIQSLVGFLMPVINEVVNIFTVAVNAVLGVLVPFVGMIVSQVQAIAAVFSGDWAGAMNFFQQTSANAQKVITNLFSGLFNILKQIVSSLANLLKTLFGGMWNGITSLTSNFVNRIVSFWSGFGNNVKNIAANLANGVKNLISNGFNAVRSIITNAVNGALSAGRNAFSGLVNAAANMASGLIGRVRQIPNMIMGVFRGAGSLLTSAGRNIVQGLINGIGSMAGAVVSKLTGIASGAINAFKGFLGIKSPSRVFMQLGAYTGEGFAIGVEKMQKQAQKAVNNLVDVPSAPVIQPQLRMANNAAAGNPAGAPATVVNINLSGVVGSRDEVRRYVSEAIEEAARRTGGALIGQKIQVA